MRSLSILVPFEAWNLKGKVIVHKKNSYIFELVEGK